MHLDPVQLLMFAASTVDAASRLSSSTGGGLQRLNGDVRD
jgi:hypothetical protein